MRTSIKTAIAAAMALSMTISGCAWFKANAGTLVTDAAQEVQCVVSEAQAGKTVEVIAVDCGSLAVVDVISILDTAGVIPVASPGLAAERHRQAVVKAAVVKAMTVKPAAKVSK